MVDEIIIEPVALGLDSALALQSITPSTSTFIQAVEQDGSFPAEDIDLIVSNVDAIGIAHEGDDTEFDRIYSWKPSFNTKIHKLNLICAIGFNVSAHSSGNFALGSVKVTITENLPDGTIRNTITTETLESGHGNLTATGSQVFIFKVRTHRDIILDQANNIQVRIETTTVNDTGTFQVGILPFFCFQSEAISKWFTGSQFKLHLKEIVKHGN